MKPTIGETENIQTNSVKITFFDPQFLQKTEYNNLIWLKGYTVTYKPYGRLAKSRNFPYNVNSSTSITLPTQPHQMKLAKLSPNTKYKLTVVAHYSTRESKTSKEQEFKTKSAGTPLDIVYMVTLACMSSRAHAFSHTSP